MIKGTDRNIPLSELHPFKDHPYKVEDNMEMDALCESIGKSGLLSPIIVRPSDEGGYEIISGHRRFRAYQRLGMSEIPSNVCESENGELVVPAVEYSSVDEVRRNKHRLSENAEAEIQVQRVFS